MQTREFPGEQAASIKKEPGSAGTENPGNIVRPFIAQEYNTSVTHSQAAASATSQKVPFIGRKSIEYVESFSPVAGGVSGAAAGEKPPILIGGSHQVQGSILNQKCGFSLFSHADLKCVDFHWFTVSTGPKISKYLLTETELHEEMGKRPGFNFSERRMCWGGHCDRHYGPKQKEKKFGFGLDYESWVFPGDISRRYVELLLSQQVKSKPTRLDIAFDFNIAAETYPRDIIDQIRSYVKKKRYGINAAGDEETGTRYIGSRENDKFLRIYRKDIENQTYGKINGPVMRVELELKGGVLRALWKVLEKKGHEYAFRLAASYVRDMTSMLLLPGDLPEVPRVEDEDSPLVERVFHIVSQYGDFIGLLKSHGVDFDAFFEAKRDNSSKWSKLRMKMIERELQSVDIQEFNQQVYDSLMSHHNYIYQTTVQSGAADEGFSRV